MSDFQSGAPLFALNPHPAFERLVRRGCAISFLIEQRFETFRELEISVTCDGAVIASANFSEDETGPYCQNCNVDPTYRRQGIATAVYIFAEIVFGRHLYDFWRGNSFQSKNAKALWSQPNRPFG